MYDVAIIGAGVVGGMIARTLSRYDIKIVILEKENDVAMGASKANSGIVHAGFDAKYGSYKAILNVKGSNMMEKVAKDLGVSYKRNGSIVVAYSEEDRLKLEQLLENGIKNGVEKLRIVEREELKSIEPNISDEVICALYAPTGAIICPYELTVASVGNAMDNGAELKCNFEVKSIVREDTGYIISSQNDTVKARYIVNTAGLYSDKVSAMIGDESFKITPRKGEYILLDKELKGYVNTTVFGVPSKMGKGILVSPTVDGNLLTGPTSVNIDDKSDKTTTPEGLGEIIKRAGRSIKNIPYNKTITSFTGLRAAADTGDFIIKKANDSFVNVAGIESPGLSASPAIAEMVRDILINMGVILKEKPDYNPIRKPMHSFRNMTVEQKNQVIKNDKSYGKIVCRCETVTEGEILEAIRTNPKPNDLDGVKRRTRAQMGRCQGGFCMPYIMKLLSEERATDYMHVTKSGNNSKVIFSKTKEV